MLIQSTKLIMRHTVTILTILFFFSSNAIAQFTVGVEAGGNYSYWQPKGEGTLKTEGKYGYYIATSPGYKFNNLITGVLNLEYSNRGIVFSELGNLNGEPIQQNITENYARISPQIHLSPIKNLVLILGPEFGFSVNEFSSSRGFSHVKSEIKFLNDLDLGAVIGTRIFIKNFFITAKYFHGFNDVSNLDFTDEYGNLIKEHQKNRNIQVGIGYRII